MYKEYKKKRRRKWKRRIKIKSGMFHVELFGPFVRSNVVPPSQMP
jgi:hypothetical protein